MSVIRICRGIQGIGKSTYAKELISKENYVRFNKDDIRSMESSTYNRSNGDLVDATMHGFIQAALKQNFNIVLDNTFCFQKHIDDIINRYHLYADIEIVSFPNDMSRAIAQNAVRTGGEFISVDIIKHFSAAYNKSTAVLTKKGYAQRDDFWNGMNLTVYEIPKKVIVPYKIDSFSSSKGSVYIFDIDNTLTIKGDRDTYDFTKCHLDTPIGSTKEIIDSLYKQYYNCYNMFPLFVTGRGEESRKETLLWLQTHINPKIVSADLFMRPWKDFRRDSIVKEEIFNKYLRSYNIVAWFDDSPKVINEFLIPYQIPFFDSTYSTF